MTQNVHALEQTVRQLEHNLECLQQQVSRLQVSFMNNGNVTMVSVVEEGQWICRDVWIVECK